MGYKYIVATTFETNLSPIVILFDVTISICKGLGFGVGGIGFSMEILVYGFEEPCFFFYGVRCGSSNGVHHVGLTMGVSD